jgi:hypothetical protein
MKAGTSRRIRRAAGSSPSPPRLPQLHRAAPRCRCARAMQNRCRRLTRTGMAFRSQPHAGVPNHRAQRRSGCSGSTSDCSGELERRERPVPGAVESTDHGDELGACGGEARIRDRPTAVVVARRSRYGSAGLPHSMTP